jgi:hypothetical protein
LFKRFGHWHKEIDEISLIQNLLFAALIQKAILLGSYEYFLKPNSLKNMDEIIWGFGGIG